MSEAVISKSISFPSMDSGRSTAGVPQLADGSVTPRIIHISSFDDSCDCACHGESCTASPGRRGTSMIANTVQLLSLEREVLRRQVVRLSGQLGAQNDAADDCAGPRGPSVESYGSVGASEGSEEPADGRQAAGLKGTIATPLHRSCDAPGGATSPRQAAATLYSPGGTPRGGYVLARDVLQRGYKAWTTGDWPDLLHKLQLVVDGASPVDLWARGSTQDAESAARTELRLRSEQCRVVECMEMIRSLFATLEDAFRAQKWDARRVEELRDRCDALVFELNGTHHLSRGERNLALGSQRALVEELEALGRKALDEAQRIGASLLVEGQMRIHRAIVQEDSFRSMLEGRDEALLKAKVDVDCATRRVVLLERHVEDSQQQVKNMSVELELMRLQRESNDGADKGAQIAEGFSSEVVDCSMRTRIREATHGMQAQFDSVVALSEKQVELLQSSLRVAQQQVQAVTVDRDALQSAAEISSDQLIAALVSGLEAEEAWARGAVAEEGMRGLWVLAIAAAMEGAGGSIEAGAGVDEVVLVVRSGTRELREGARRAEADAEALDAAVACREEQDGAAAAAQRVAAAQASAEAAMQQLRSQLDDERIEKDRLRRDHAEGLEKVWRMHYRELELVREAQERMVHAGDRAVSAARAPGSALGVDAAQRTSPQPNMAIRWSKTPPSPRSLSLDTISCSLSPLHPLHAVAPTEGVLWDLMEGRQKLLLDTLGDARFVHQAGARLAAACMALECNRIARSRASCQDEGTCVKEQQRLVGGADADLWGGAVRGPSPATDASVCSCTVAEHFLCSADSDKESNVSTEPCGENELRHRLATFSQRMLGISSPLSLSAADHIEAQSRAMNSGITLPWEELRRRNCADASTSPMIFRTDTEDATGSSRAQAWGLLPGDRNLMSHLACTQSFQDSNGDVMCPAARLDFDLDQREQRLHEELRRGRGAQQSMLHDIEFAAASEELQRAVAMLRTERQLRQELELRCMRHEVGQEAAERLSQDASQGDDVVFRGTSLGSAAQGVKRRAQLSHPKSSKNSSLVHSSLSATTDGHGEMVGTVTNAQAFQPLSATRHSSNTTLTHAILHAADSSVGVHAGLFSPQQTRNPVSDDMLSLMNSVEKRLCAEAGSRPLHPGSADARACKGKGGSLECARSGAHRRLKQVSIMSSLCESTVSPWNATGLPSSSSAGLSAAGHSSTCSLIDDASVSAQSDGCQCDHSAPMVTERL